MVRRLIALLALLAGLVTAPPALAWWQDGHRQVAAIAWANIQPRTQRAVRRLLARAPMLHTPACPVATIEEASLWADCIKPLKDRFGYAETWHYQDADICLPFDLKPVCANGNCVSAQIERDLRLLRDPKVPVAERLQALLFLVHFVGDLHQPLHAGEHGDAGGNGVKARYGIYETQRLNLHAVWDGLLAERAIFTPPSLVRRYPPAERAPMQAGTIADWSRESWQAAKDHVYPTVIADPCGPAPTGRVTLTNDSIATLVPVVRDLVTKGGLRLARLLDETFGGAAPGG